MSKTPSPRKRAASPAARVDSPTVSQPLALVTKPSDPKGKLGVLIAQLRRPGGVSLHDLAAATQWQLHSVRGAMAGALKARGYAINSIKAGKGALRLYSLVEPAEEA